MVTTEYLHIAKEQGYRGGMARVKHAGVTVAGIVIMNRGGDSLETIVEMYPNLTMDAAREALEYSSSHHEEIERDIYTLTHPPAGFGVGPNGILKKK